VSDIQGLPPIDARFVPELIHDDATEGSYGSFKSYWGNCLDVQEVVERNSVALVVTSPPYPGVEQPTDDYVTFKSPEDFRESHKFLAEVWATMFNLLADEGRLAINIYDIPKGAEGMYANVAQTTLICQSIGFVLREDYIWHKGASYRPPSGSWPYPKGVLSGNTYEHILVFQKPLKFSQRRFDPKNYPEAAREASKLGKTEGDWLSDPVWKIKADREARKIGHPFPFPPELPERLIKLYTMVGDTVFDPFGGAGTTGIVAQRLGRHGIITELSKPFLEMIDKRTAQQSMF
jgi:site-specific DNA-methyltransferase (adenine-specific)